MAPAVRGIFLEFPLRKQIRFLLTLVTAVIGSLSLSGSLAQTPTTDERTTFRVCQDPNNLPFSNVGGEGYENKIAELFARELGLKLEYYSFPQRMAFIRNTLRYKLPGENYRCDIVLGVPAGYDQVSATKSYYRSTYALVFPKKGPLADVRSGDQFVALPPEVLRKLRIGLFDRSPASEWLARRGLVEQGVPYRILNANPDQYPGEIIEKDLAEGKIDVAVVWGPIAGFFARRVKTPELVVVPLKSEPGVKFDFEMAMGVRYGEKPWKDEIEKLLAKKQPEIRAILASYNVPLIDDNGRLLGSTDKTELFARPTDPAPYRVVDGKVDNSTFLGWRIFHSSCVGCHGTDATGTGVAPDLTKRINDMPRSSFIATILQRYNVVIREGEAASESVSREAFIEQILQGKAGRIAMPVWDGDPNVAPNVNDVYAYLRARADGALGTGRPGLLDTGFR